MDCCKYSYFVYKNEKIAVKKQIIYLLTPGFKLYLAGATALHIRLEPPISNYLIPLSPCAGVNSSSRALQRGADDTRDHLSL